MTKRLLLLLFFPLAVFAQTGNTGAFSKGPYSNRPVCSRNVSDSNAHNGDIYSDTDGENVYKCSGGTWRIFGGGTTSPTHSLNPFDLNTDMIRSGPNPYVDIRAYGAYATFSSTTCNTTSGSFRVRLKEASNFRNDEYATCYNAGAAPLVSTPARPTVTPSVHAGGMGATSDGGGSTSYAYEVVAEDKYNGRSAASAAGSTSKGQATLGQTAHFNISGCTRSNQTVTCTTTATHPFIIGQMIWTQNMTNHTFNGSWITISPTSGSTITFKSNWDTRNGAPASSTPSATNNVFGYKMNRLTWTAVTNAFRYHIYGPNCPTNCNWLGQSMVQRWDDYGSPMMDGQPRPPYIPARAPSSTANQHFTFKINSGGGTTVLMADSNAGATVSSTVVSDVGPALIAAAQASYPSGNSASDVYIPNTSGLKWQVNSYTDFGNSIPVSLFINGTALSVNQPLANVYAITGSNAGGNKPGFGWASYPTVSGTAFPLIFGHANLPRVTHISMYPNTTNGGLAVYAIDPINFIFEDFFLSSSNGNAADCIGQSFLFNASSTAFIWFAHRFTISSGTCGGSQYPGSTPVPTMVSTALAGGQAGNGMSFEQGWFLNRASFDIDNNGVCNGGVGMGGSSVYTQNSTEPIFQVNGTCGGAINFSLSGGFVADFSTPVIANYSSNQSGIVTVNSFGGPAGIATGIITGNPIAGVSTVGEVPADAIGSNSQLLAQTTGALNDGTYSTTQGTSQALNQISEHTVLGAGYSLFTSTSQPAAATCAAVTAGPPFTIAMTTSFKYAAVYPNGGVGLISPASNVCRTDGTSQQVTITIPTAIPGAIGYAIYGTSLLSCSLPTTTSLSYTYTNAASLGCGQQPATLAGGGPGGLRDGTLWGTDLNLTATTAPAGAANATHVYMDSITNWPSFKLNGNRAYLIPGISGPIVDGHNLCASGMSGAYADCLMTRTIASGTSTLRTSPIAARNCAAVVTAPATDVTVTDAVSYSFNSAPSGAYATGLFIQSYVTPGTVNFLVCNPTTESLTPSEATLNWHVTR